MAFVFVDTEASKKFQCSVCYEIFKNPVQIGCDDHIFCEDCITSTITHSFLTMSGGSGTAVRCPICRASCEASSIRRVKFVERQINDLLVKCPNHAITDEKAKYLKHKHKYIQTLNQNQEDTVGSPSKKVKPNDEELCDWIGPLSDVESHTQQCMLQLISCDFCSEFMLQRDLHHHHHEFSNYPTKCSACGEENISRSQMELHVEEHCPNTMISCSQQCGMQIRRKEQDEHISNVCPETMMKCAFERFGCHFKFKRKHERAHIENASMSHNHLVQISEKVNQLQMENQSVRLRMDVLEARLNKHIRKGDKNMKSIRNINAVLRRTNSMMLTLVQKDMTRDIDASNS
eukprot:250050_1